MISKQIHKARLALKHAGAVADRDQLRDWMVSELRNDLEVLSERKAAIKEDYRKRLEKWETKAVPDSVPVMVNPANARDRRLYRLTGWIALLSEMALAAWVFARLGVAFWIGALTALGITFTLHGIFLYLFEDEDRPKATMHRIKVFAALPAIVGFLVAVAGGALARYVTGHLAYLLLPFFSFSLWLGILSLIVLAASLFTIAHVKGWAVRHEWEHRQADAEERATRAFLQELEKEDGDDTLKLQPQRPALIPSETPKVHMLGIIILMMMTVIFNSACTATGASGEIDTPNAVSATPGGDLHVFIDWSGSCVRPALEEAWNTARSELPEIIETHRIGTLTIWSFDQDGWSPTRLKELQLPARRHPSESVKVDAGEWESFSNIREALRDAETKEREKSERAEQDRYSEALKDALVPLDSAVVLASPDYATPQSDIAGLFERISVLHENRAEYILVLTDLADTKRKALPQFSAPHGEVHVLVLVIPADRQDTILTLGKPLSASEQFEARLRQLHDMAPWASAAPYFAHNLAALMSGTAAY